MACISLYTLEPRDNTPLSRTYLACVRGGGVGNVAASIRLKRHHCDELEMSE